MDMLEVDELVGRWVGVSAWDREAERRRIVDTLSSPGGARAQANVVRFALALARDPVGRQDGAVGSFLRLLERLADYEEAGRPTVEELLASMM